MHGLGGDWAARNGLWAVGSYCMSSEGSIDQRVQIQHGSIMRAVKTMYSLFCFRCIWFSVCDPNVICMVQLSSDLRKQYLYRTTAVLCAQCLDLSNLDNPRGTDSHIIGHAFSEPPGLITCRGVGGCMQNRLIPSPLSDCGRARKSRREMGGHGQVSPSLPAILVEYST